MLSRNDYPIDIQPGPWPSSGLIGFVKGPEDEAYQPMYRVRKADWDDLRRFGEQQRTKRAMKTIDVIERELKELQLKADGIVTDTYTYTSEVRALAFNLSSAIGNAIQACKLPSEAKAPF